MSTAVGDEKVADSAAPPQQEEAPQDAADLFGGLKKKSGKKKKIPMDFDLDGDSKPEKSASSDAPAADAPKDDAPKEESESAPAPQEGEAAPADDGALDVRALCSHSSVK